MNLRLLTPIALGLCGATALLAALNQSHQLQKLTLEERQMRTLAGTSLTAAPPTSVVTPVAESSTPLTDQELLELMRLRNQVRALRQQQRELAGIRGDNANLRAQLAAASTNQAASQVKLPPGYMRRRDAQFVGYNTPEATLQSFFWGLANRDTNVLFHAMDGIDKDLPRGGDQEAMFWQIPGFHILKSETLSDTEVALTIEILPGDEHTFKARKTDQEWKLYP